MTIKSLIMILGASLFAIYFYLFQRHLKTLSPRQLFTFSRRTRPGPWINLAITIPLCILILIGDQYLRIAAAVLLIIFALISSHLHHKSLLEQGFSVSFIRKLRLLSVLALLAGALMISSILL